MVYLQLTKLGESLVTLGTGIMFLPGVNFNVSPQVTRLGEGLCTAGAGVRRQTAVCPLVNLQFTKL